MNHAENQCDRKPDLGLRTPHQAQWRTALHFTKTYPISIASLHEAITQYNADYDDEVDARQLIEATISAKILMPDSSTANMYKFSTQSQLSYFVARELNRRYHDDSYESDDIRIVLENACFGINGDILLFITYLTDNIKILRYIIEAAKNRRIIGPSFRLPPVILDTLNQLDELMSHLPTQMRKKKSSRSASIKSVNEMIRTKYRLLMSMTMMRALYQTLGIS